MLTIKSLIVLVFCATAFIIVAKRVALLLKFANSTNGVLSVPRFNNIPERIKSFIVYVLLQRKVLDYKGGGTMHVMFFYGFIVLTFGTVEMIIQGIFNGFTWEVVFGEKIANTILLGIDCMSVLVLVAICISIYRRVINPRPFLVKSNQAYIILGLIFSLVFSYYFMMAFHIIETTGGTGMQAASAIQPVSAPLAAILYKAGFGENAYLGHEIFWWMHLLIVLFFGVYVVFSKHLHVLFAAPNVFMRNLEPKGRMVPMNFEDENALQFGVAKVTDFSWKDVIDSYACTECGRCTDQCPAHHTGKPLDPRKIVHDIQDAFHANKNEALTLLQNKSNPEKYIETRESIKSITEFSKHDEIWSCTTCGACMEWCPVFIEQVPKITESRRNLVMMEANFPEEAQVPFRNLETNYNPWSFGWDQREAWAQGLDIRYMKDIPAENPPEYLYWVGCAGSFDDRNQKVSKAVVKILNSAEVDFAILGNEEKCTGDPARRLGNEYLAQTLIKENVETLNKYKVQKVLTACPHCLNTLKNEYKDFGIELEVVHHSQLIDELMKSGKIKLDKKEGENEGDITFHDPCYLARWNDEVDAPRDVLQSACDVSGNSIKEMPRNKKMGFCCGAGGGQMFLEENIGKRVNEDRTEEAVATGASVIATGCPFCMTMMTDGVKSVEGENTKTTTLDIAEIIADRIQ